MGKPVEIPRADERRELARILASNLFQRAPRLATLLAFLCEKYFAGDAASLKEYSIATEAMGLPPDFSEKKGAVVRVEMHRLRKRLDRYFETEGAGDELLLELLPGQYVPRFVPRTPLRDSSAAFDSREETHSEFEESEGEEALVSELLVQEQPDEVGFNQPNGALATPQQPVHPARRGAGFGWARPSNLAIVVLAFAILAAAWLYSRSRAAVATVPAAGEPTTPAPVSAGGASTTGAIRILAGNSHEQYVDRMGEVWHGDNYFNGGYASHYEGEARPGYIRAATDPGLFQSYRSGDFAYDIPAKPGTYELRLYFMEHKFGEGTVLGGGEESRTFDVYLNDQVLLWRFDILADCGQAATADVKLFRDVSPSSDGKIHLRFQSVHDRAMLSAIEILPGLTGRTLPLRLLAQDHSFTDSDGRVWESDRFFSGGRSAPTQGEVSGTRDAALFGGERFGNFSYIIPVDARDRYTVNMYFAENFFGTGNPGSTDARRRTFDVFCNGATLLRNFEILKEVTARKALVKSFHDLRPTATGKLQIQFMPAGHHALVNAIEVLDEGS